MKKCKNCSARFPDNFNFCLRCGAKAPKYPTFGGIAAGFFKGVCFVLLFTAIQGFVSLVYSLFESLFYITKNSGDIQIEAFTDELLSHIDIISIISAALTFICVLIYFKLIRKKALKELGNAKFALWTAPLIIILGLALNYFITVGSSFIPVPDEYLEKYEQIYSFMGRGPFIVEFIDIALCAPIIEEIIFRGMCYGSMKKVMPKWVAVIISSVIFGIAHGNMISLVYTSILGVLLAVIYEKTGSIFAPMLLHFGFNGGSYIVELTPDYNSVLFFAVILFASALISVVCFTIIYTANAEKDEIQTGISDTVYFNEANIGERGFRTEPFKYFPQNEKTDGDNHTDESRLNFGENQNDGKTGF